MKRELDISSTIATQSGTEARLNTKWEPHEISELARSFKRPDDFLECEHSVFLRKIVLGIVWPQIYTVFTTSVNCK